MKRFSNLLLAMASGLLLWAAWPVSPFTFLIFVAWIPLLWVEARVKSRKLFFGLTYITMFTWNVSTTWWIWNASEPGATAAFLANSLLMCFPWLGFRIVKKWKGDTFGHFALVAFWMCFEYLHLQDWGLSWPWLTLGNAFATHPQWVQWYSVTGTSGGTFWILVVNILLYEHLQKNFLSRGPKTYKHLLASILLLVVPVTYSWFLPVRKQETNGTHNIVIVQPNIDPYEKVSDEAGSFEGQLQKLITLSERAIDEHTSLVIWPETALYTGHGIEEDKMKQNFLLRPLWSFLERHPSLNLFTGVESVRIYDDKRTATAREAGQGFYYDAFNGSALLDSSGAKGFYHKSMLVPGVETLPWFLRFMDAWFEKFGGTTAGYARQKERTVLNAVDNIRIAPAICYESIYGEFMRRYIKNGANLICIITNDGWWRNTPGHKQHMNYARLRAIETRRWVARSANTGISCFIDPYGNVLDPQGWDTMATIKMPFYANTTETFFVREGDMLSRIMIFLSAFLVGSVIWLRVRKTIINKSKKTKTAASL